MPRPRLSMRVAISIPIMFAMLFMGARAWLDPFRTYQHSSAWDDHIRWQKDGSGRLAMLKVSTFPSGRPSKAARCDVDSFGHAASWIDIPGWPFQRIRLWHLQGPQVQDVRRSLLALPPSDSPPPLRQLLVLSFDDGGAWRTRIYDRSRLAPTVGHLLKTIAYRPK